MCACSWYTITDEHRFGFNEREKKKTLYKGGLEPRTSEMLDKRSTTKAHKHY